MTPGTCLANAPCCRLLSNAPKTDQYQIPIPTQTETTKMDPACLAGLDDFDFELYFLDPFFVSLAVRSIGCACGLLVSLVALPPSHPPRRMSTKPKLLA